MEKLELIIQKLKQENFEPKIEINSVNEKIFHKIVWKDETNDECWIFEDDIAIYDKNIAWFQSSKNDNHLLKIYDNASMFTWTPITYNPVFGCYCILIEWYQKHIIFIYQEKHDIYVCSIAEKNVKYFNFHGAEIERKGDLISYETFMYRTPDKIKLIKIPELNVIEPIDRIDAERLGLVPLGLNRPGNFLGYK